MRAAEEDEGGQGGRGPGVLEQRAAEVEAGGEEELERVVSRLCRKAMLWPAGGSAIM